MRTHQVIAVALLFGAPLAGCIGVGGEEKAVNEPPTAALLAVSPTGWTGEDVVFDGRNSTDPDGAIALYRFDFGDGTVTEVKQREAARLTHAYERGGHYFVTLTVIDDGKETAGAQSATASAPMIINERAPLEGQVFFAAPPVNATLTREDSQAFEVRPGATGFELNMTLDGLLVVGTSRIIVKVLDASGNALDEATVDLDGMTAETVELVGVLLDDGKHTVEVTAETGGARFAGELRILYEAPEPADENMKEEES